MKAINWDEIMLFWNRVFNTEYKTHKQMLKAAYKEFPSLGELSLKLDINPETIRLKMKKEGVKIRASGDCSIKKKE